MDRKSIRTLILGAMSCIVLYWLLHETQQVVDFVLWAMKLIQPFLVGAGIAFILNVPMRAIERVLRQNTNFKSTRGFSILMTFALLGLLVTMVVYLLIPQIRQTAEIIAQQLPPFLDRVETAAMAFLEKNPQVGQWLANNTDFQQFDWAAIAQQALDFAGSSLKNILGSTVSAVGGVISSIWGLVVSVIFGIYCLGSKEQLARQSRQITYALLPERWADELVRIARLVNTTFSNFISGQCIEVFILGCMFALTMTVLGMPYVPLVSVLVAVTAFVPIVGAWIGCILGAFFILVNDPMQAVWFVVMFLVLQQIENNLIYPRVVGTSVGLPSIWTLAAVKIGADLMGVAGMVLMIPVTSVLYTLIREFTADRLALKNIDEDKLKAQPPELKSRLKEKREHARRRREARRAAELAELMKQKLHIPDVHMKNQNEE